MGMILIEGMEFWAHHGCYEEERRTGNRFTVDLEVGADMERASQSDRLEDTLNYQQACDIISREMQQPSKLLEHVAGRILRALRREFSGAGSMRVKVVKHNPPVDGQVARFSVLMED
jgi:7,8-dihydroneopterin aldolase/epimerase/oxygenase